MIKNYHFATTPFAVLLIVTALAVAVIESSEAFVMTPQGKSSLSSVSSSSSTSLNLLPGQGNQLVAAYNAAIWNRHKDDDADSNNNHILIDDQDDAMMLAKIPIAENDDNVFVEIDNQPTSAVARSFVSRVFSLPSSMIKRHPHPKAEGLMEDEVMSTTSEHDDIVYYPVVGFTFVQTSNNECFALPTTSSAACRIRKSKNEDLFGWYSSACNLDYFSEDPCHPPQ